MSRFLEAVALAGLAALSVTAVGLAQTQQQRPAQQQQQRQAQPPALPALPWANSPNAQVMGARVVRSETGAFPERRLGIGREARAEEIRGWDIDIRPDGQGLPVGRGSVSQGEELYMAQCASCHGDFGESAGRWPMLSGGQGSLATPDPMKTVGSFWPYASTLWDYIHRTMPFGNAQSLSADETYAITAYVLYLNDVITDSNFVLTNENLATIRMPNRDGFFLDDRERTEASFWRRPCMTNCAPSAAQVTGRARVLDVTPETQGRRGGGID